MLYMRHQLAVWILRIRAIQLNDIRALFIAPRPQTQQEFANREAVMEQAKRNRAVAAMTLAAAYVWLMRYAQSDLFLLMLLVLEYGIFYAATQYKAIAIYFTKRTAKARVNRVKDWVAFHVGAGSLVRGNGGHPSAAAAAVAEALEEDESSDDWQDIS